MERPEPLLAERVWAHLSDLSAERMTVSAELDEAGRPVRVMNSDGGSESYTYDAQGRLVEIEEYDLLSTTVVNPQRWDTGGRLKVEHDDRGALRISGPHDMVWERCEEPWPELLRRGAASLADRCVEAIAGAEVDPGTEVYCLMLMYVSDGGLHTLVNAGLESDRRETLDDDDPHNIACNLWYPEAPDLSLLEVEHDDELDVLVLREAALNDRRAAQRTVLTEAAKLLARRDWSGLLTLTSDFVVYVAEHDEGFSEKHESVREVNPPERVAVWDARWPRGVPRED